MELRRRRDTQAITFQRTTEQWKCVLRLNEPARIDNMPDSPMLLLLACESVASVVAEREEVSEAVQVDVAAAAVGSGARGAVVTLEEVRRPKAVALAGDVAVVTHINDIVDGRVLVLNAHDGKVMRELQLGPKIRANGVAIHGDTIYVSTHGRDDEQGLQSCILKFGLHSVDGKSQGRIGTHGSGAGELNCPTGLAISGGELYVADSGNHRVQVFGLDGKIARAWGSEGKGPGQFDHPDSIAVRGEHVYVTDCGNHRVQVFGVDGRFVLEWGSEGSAEGQFSGPRGIALHGELVYVVDECNHRVQVFGCDGTFVYAWGSEGSGLSQFGYPVGLAVHGGHVWVCDRRNHRVLRFR